MLYIPPSASGAVAGVAEWIRKAATAVNILIGRSDGHETRLTAAEAALTALEADKLEWVAVPASATATGTAGQVAYESGFFYICVATDTWERVAIATWP